MAIWCLIRPLSCMLMVIFHLVVIHDCRVSSDSPTSHTETRIGVIIDESSRIGKEQKTAMKIAAQNFNDNSSNNLKFSLIFRNSSSIKPLQAASSAKELATKEGVKAIIGTETWQQAALVAQVGEEYNIPVLSLAPAPSTPPLSSQRWPFLIEFSSNYTEQIRCIASMVECYGWRRVIAVYEDDGYAGISQMLTLLSQALLPIGSEIEHKVVLPPISVVSNFINYPNEVVLGELVKVLSNQSRVFIVLQSSLPVARYLFKGATQVGLVGRETAWLITESVAGLLYSVDSTFVSNAEGVVGVKSYYRDSGDEFLDFLYKFRLEFRSGYPEEENFQGGIHALRAYDGITAVVKAVEKNNRAGSRELLEGILSSRFRGLSGDISFNDQNRLSKPPALRVVNVVGGSSKELDLWTSEKGFFEDEKELGYGDPRSNSNCCPTGKVRGDIVWPGGVIDHVPKGWAVPVNAKPLKIGVPGRTSFEKFVKVEKQENANRIQFTGYCIDVFVEVVKNLELSYTLPYEFVAFNGTYDELVDNIENGSFDAVVGDVTILANRSMKVEFTQPYAKSGLSMLIPIESKDSQKAWLFTKPFTWQMWAVTGATLLYTMFVVWFLEHTSNPEFSGSRRNQLSAAFWFTFTSIFFAQRERVQSNYTRVAVGVWLVLVLVLTQSYTASFTSVLTVPLLKASINDVSWLRDSGQKVGCDGDSFVRDYLTDVLGFKAENVINISSQYSYPDYFDNRSIVAAFLEVPYARVFLNQYCKKFTDYPSHNYRLGGLGFVFPKGSPMAEEVSKAILRLSEAGILKSLDDKWFSPSSECSNTDSDTERLSIQGFWILYLFSGVVSTVSIIFFLNSYGHRHLHRRHADGNAVTRSPSGDSVMNAGGEDSVWGKIVKFFQQSERGIVLVARTNAAAATSLPVQEDEDEDDDNDEFVMVTPTTTRWDCYSPMPTDSTRSEIEMSPPVR